MIMKSQGPERHSNFKKRRTADQLNECPDLECINIGLNPRSITVHKVVCNRNVRLRSSLAQHALRLLRCGNSCDSLELMILDL